MEQSANPAARVEDITLGQFRRANKTHLFVHWQLQRRVTVFFVRCVQIGLLIYLPIYLAYLLTTLQHITVQENSRYHG